MTAALLRDTAFAAACLPARVTWSTSVGADEAGALSGVTGAGEAGRAREAKLPASTGGSYVAVAGGAGADAGRGI